MYSWISICHIEKHPGNVFRIFVWRESNVKMRLQNTVEKVCQLVSHFFLYLNDWKNRITSSIIVANDFI